MKVSGTQTEMAPPSRGEIAAYVGKRTSLFVKGKLRNGTVVHGTVEEILTRTTNHPYGIKVRLKNGYVCRVVEIIARSYRF